MIMVKHHQMSRLLGDRPLTAIERGTKERVHPLDQRGGPDNGVELVEHQRFKGVKRVAQEPCGAPQPAVSFLVMVTLCLRPGLGDEMLMGPCQHEKISGIVGYPTTACRRHRFGVFERDYKVIERRAHGRERMGNGGAVKLVHEV